MEEDELRKRVKQQEDELRSNKELLKAIEQKRFFSDNNIDPSKVILHSAIRAFRPGYITNVICLNYDGVEYVYLDGVEYAASNPQRVFLNNIFKKDKQITDSNVPVEVLKLFQFIKNKSREEVNKLLLM
jgi:hypothetical protein